jgi:hypothetical protein
MFQPMQHRNLSALGRCAPVLPPPLPGRPRCSQEALPGLLLVPWEGRPRGLVHSLRTQAPPPRAARPRPAQPHLPPLAPPAVSEGPGAPGARDRSRPLLRLSLAVARECGPRLALSANLRQHGATQPTACPRTPCVPRAGCMQRARPRPQRDAPPPSFLRSCVFGCCAACLLSPAPQPRGRILCGSCLAQTLRDVPGGAEGAAACGPYPTPALSLPVATVCAARGRGAAPALPAAQHSCARAPVRICSPLRGPGPLPL